MDKIDFNGKWLPNRECIGFTAIHADKPALRDTQCPLLANNGTENKRWKVAEKAFEKSREMTQLRYE